MNTHEAIRIARKTLADTNLIFLSDSKMVAVHFPDDPQKQRLADQTADAYNRLADLHRFF